MYNRIKELCKIKGMTVRDLEAKTGFARNSLCKINNHQPKPDKLKKLSEVLGVSIDYLLNGKEPNNNAFSTDTALLLADLQFNEQFLEIAKMYKELSAERQQDIYDYVQMLYAKK